VEITAGALKHGIGEQTIRAVVAAPFRTVPQGERTLLIGVDAARDLLEVVVEGHRVVHAMRLRPKNYDHLRPE
jgi:nitrogenase subunit NifH